ncbi:hypothetical protein BO83DRAFT_41615 [Aspergillus eucalypticola CBS 122712]|uniref:Uncharacterized protein n=1 Tax=Aspergillus eucalypticola (strain CBS 122712 / IBT 29274) TaxID=1448314 RepID=A0A317VIL2_ASPEC|nr:uncharacterized protein BO83DRAFT_41615 [Aspergillus eucalypticola CBS 122712]PWY72858.1 hypothetical protein BO83DRAFT_41615 [Aspergillus eucalypticola CBS 122712]
MLRLSSPAHGDSRESCCQSARCPRAPPDGLLFVPHQPEVIDAMKKLPSTPCRLQVLERLARRCVQTPECPTLTLLRVFSKV